MNKSQGYQTHASFSIPGNFVSDLLSSHISQRNLKSILLALLPVVFCMMQASGQRVTAGTINRQALVERHKVTLEKADPLASLSVGNGRFAFTVDITGLQSFPDDYAAGVPLGTQSEWGWHSFPNTEHIPFENSLRSYYLNGRERTYAVEWKNPEENKKASEYYRQNQHRLQLGNIGLELIKKDGSLATINDLEQVYQTLNPWTGEIHSQFSLEGSPVDVITYGHQVQDAIATKISSPLIKEGRLLVRVRFPYPTGKWADVGNNWEDANKHFSSIHSKQVNGARILHRLDTTTYFCSASWSKQAVIREKSKHYFIIEPSRQAGSFELSVRFEPVAKNTPVPGFAATAQSSKAGWQSFWKSGGAIDFAGSTDQRAFELERRIILSQYLTKLQCAGDNPPQETGLTYNSWFGKPHMEMHWWHAVHFALWGRPELLAKSMDWYSRAAGTAAKIAKRQGYEGVRWQKVTDNDGREVPSSIGAFLVWQQPHFIWMAELLYRQKKDPAVLNKYKDLVFSTAAFMASFAHYDPETGKYNLGKGLIPAQERFEAVETFNPGYELAYWHWGLAAAQAWRERLRLPRNKKWDSVLTNLAPLPVQGDKYLFTENATDSYTNPRYSTDHPSIFGALGMLPQTGMVDTLLMKNTFDWIWENWTWDKTWGWDFPLTAMTAARLGWPEKAMDALFMGIKTNTYLPNGHNYQDERLTLYLPGNGGLLTAIAMMVAGFDEDGQAMPGIPKDGSWKLKWEGLEKMP